MNFCDKLQKIRKENNITQEQLADKLNVSRQAVSKWESGAAYPDTEKLIQISKIFNVSLDELINNDNIKKENNLDDKKLNIMEIFNNIFDFISKSVNMFWSMKFTEKFKCLFEMGVLAGVIIIAALISTNVICEIVRRLFMFLPYNFVHGISSLVDTLLYIVWIILGVIIFVKVFKTRYLDYYIIINDDSVPEKTIEEPIKELKEKKEYKVVIRDPEHSSFNLIRQVFKVLVFALRCLALLVAIPVIMMFIFFVLLLIFSITYMFYGLFFDGIILTILGVVILTYLLIKFIYNLIFNQKTIYSRMFLIFIVSISLIGMGLGLSLSALTKFKVYQSDNYNQKESTVLVDMSDNLVIYDIMDSDSEIVIDNNLSNIKMTILSNKNSNVAVYKYKHQHYNDDDREEFITANINVDYNISKVYKSIINDLKHKRIDMYSTYNGYDDYKIEKVYISESNLAKLKDNYNRLNSN